MPEFPKTDRLKPVLLTRLIFEAHADPLLHPLGYN
jgi:hypothetical protein